MAFIDSKPANTWTQHGIFHVGLRLNLQRKLSKESGVRHI